MIKVTHLLPLFGILAACADPVSMSYTLHLDPRIPADLQSDMIVAANRWEDKVGVKIDIIVEDVDCNVLDSSFNICMHPSTEDYVQSRGGEGASAITIIHPLGSNSNVFVAMDAPSLSRYYSDTTEKHVELFRGTMTHEIGHAMGLVHTDIPTDLMYTHIRIGRNTDITCNDVDQFSTYRGIRIPCVEGSRQLPTK